MKTALMAMVVVPLLAACVADAGEAIGIGSKQFTESFVLAEIANDPNLSPADIERVRRDMNTKGILFEIRVLRARSSDQESGLRTAKGATI